MWSALLLFIRQLFLKDKLKKLSKKTGKNGKEIKKLKSKIIVSSILIILIIMSLVLVGIVLHNMMLYGMLTVGTISSNQTMDAGDDLGLNSEEEGSADSGLGSNPGSEDPSYKDPSYKDPSYRDPEEYTGGIYPKDPKLKQLAIILEIINNSCGLVNADAGYIKIVPSSIITTMLRESGGALINDCLDDTSINIFGQLVYQNPICRKGGNCKWINGGTSHFVGGSVSGGKDTGDPHTQVPNTDKSLYDKYSGDHALGYGQFEVPYIDEKMPGVYPVGQYLNTQYNNSTDRYKIDSELNFIRPNVAYIPDVLYNTTVQLGYSFSSTSGSQKVWNEMQGEAWFNSLSEEEKAFVFGSFKQILYVGGSGVDKTNMTVAKYTIKLCWALKEDGYIGSIRDIIQWASTKYPDKVGSRLNNLYKNQKITYPGMNFLTDVFNAILSDTSLGPNAKAVIPELKSALAAASNGKQVFEYYSEANGYKWRQLIPGAIGLESCSWYIYQLMLAEVNGAEKDEPAPEGAYAINANGIGTGNFYNPINSEYYAPDLSSIFYSQNKAGGESYFGHTLPAYTTTIQGKPYLSSTYKAIGCPAYSMAMLLSNMLGTEILPDKLPGTTTAVSPWKSGSHSVQSSGLGYVSGTYVIDAVNKTLKESGANFELKYARLTQQQLASYGTAVYDWLDKGAMLWVRVVNVNCAASNCKSASHKKLGGGACEHTYDGNHFVTISGYDKNSRTGEWYDIRILNSIVSASTYTLCNATQGQRATASNLQGGLAAHLRNYPNYCCMVVWRTDIAETLPGL